MPKFRLGLPSVILASTSLLLTACATGPQVPSVAELLSRSTGQDGGACLQTSEVRRYSVVNDELIFVDASLGSYIVTVNPGCQDLGTTPGFAFETRFQRACGGSMDNIKTRGYECTIREIFEFETRDAAFAAFEDATAQHQLLESKAEKQ